MDRLRDIEKKYFIIAGICIAIVALVIIFFTLKSQSDERANQSYPVHAALAVKLGDESQKNKMVVYMDPVCDHCAEYHGSTLMKVYDNYVKTDKVLLEVRPLAIVSDASAPLVGLMMCGNEQQKFWTTSAYVFAELNRNNKTTEQNAADFFTEHSADQIAKELSMDSGKLRSCLGASKYRNDIEQANNEAYAAGINSTPLTFIGDSPAVRGIANYDYLKALLDTNFNI